MGKGNKNKRDKKRGASRNKDRERQHQNDKPSPGVSSSTSDPQDHPGPSASDEPMDRPTTISVPVASDLPSEAQSEEMPVEQVSSALPTVGLENTPSEAEQKLKERLTGLIQMFPRDRAAAADPPTTEIEGLLGELERQIAEQLEKSKGALEAAQERIKRLTREHEERIERVGQTGAAYQAKYKEALGEVTILKGEIQKRQANVEDLSQENLELKGRAERLSSDKKEAMDAKLAAERERQSLLDEGARLAAETRDEFLRAVMAPIYEAVVDAATEAAGRFALVRLAMQNSEATGETENERVARDFLMPVLAGTDSKRFREFLEAGTGGVGGEERLLRRLVSKLRPFPATVHQGLMDESIAREVQLDAADIRAVVERLRGARVTIPAAYQDCFEVDEAEASSVYRIVRPGWMVGRAVLLPARLEAVTP